MSLKTSNFYILVMDFLTLNILFATQQVKEQRKYVQDVVEKHY